MAEKDKNNFVVNDKTYVKKPEIHYSYKFQPHVKDLGGSPGKNITQEDRNKRQKHENNVNAVRNVVKGLNNTFGKAISGAAAFYGGGWALNRLLHLNKPSTLGQFFGRYVLPANTADNISDGVELIFDPSIKGTVDLGSGVVLGRFKDLSKPVRQVGELIGQGANINNMKNGGQVRKMQTASGGPIELYDTQWVDNWKNRLTSPIVVAKQLTEQTSKIPIKYLGGSKDNVRKEFWKQEPVFQHAVDSIANQYGISPESLKYRLDKEGFTDRLIQRRNDRIKIGDQKFEPRGYELLNNPNYGLDGTQIGLDDAKTYIDSGKVKLINENWDERSPFKNEKGRMTYPVNPVTLNDGMGIVAAHLKYFRDEAQQDFPNGSEYDLDRYANAYYNRGTYGGKKWVQAGAKGYNYRKKGGMLQLLKKGSGIHIKKKNRGKFTSYCGGKVTDECIRKAKASGNPTLVKRATFAQNSRKWKHQEGGVLIDYSGDNRNAMGGDIIASVMEYLKNKKQIQEQQKDQELMKKYLEIQKSQQTSDIVQSLIGTASDYIMNNLGGLSKIFSKKSTTDNGSPSTTTSMYKLSNFWSNPSIANSLT